MRFRVEHPTQCDRHAIVGYDHAVGFFADVFEGDFLVATIEVITDPEGNSLPGVLALLIDHGFLTEDDVDDAYRQLPHLTPDEIDDEDTRRAAEVIVALKLASS